MRATIETIGPERAAQMLEMNTSNFRKLDQTRVRLFAKEMESGNWKENGESIKFSGNLLVDGQTRLSAIVKSGVTIRMVVVYDADKGGIDRGKSRTVGQWLAHHGIKNSSNIAAMAKLCVVYERGKWGKGIIQRADVVDSEIMEFAMSNNDRMQSAYQVASLCHRVCTPTIIGAIVYYGSGDLMPTECKTATWFSRSLGTGENLASTDAVFHLRSRMLGQNATSQIDPTMKRALATLAWNKTARGELCSSASIRLRLTGPSPQLAPSVIETAVE